jgi:hypothetical protein
MAKAVEQIKQDKEYHPSYNVGVCSVCHVVGTLDFSRGGFSYKVGDKVMSRLKVKCFCTSCGKETEFIPLIADGKTTAEGQKWIVKLEQDLQKQLIGEKL